MLLTKFNDFISVGEIARHDALKDSFKIIKNETQNVVSKQGDNKQIKYKKISIIKRKDNRWWARFRKGGKQFSIYGNTQIECYAKLKKYMDGKIEFKNNINKPKNDKSILYIEWIVKWLETYKKPILKEPTYYKYVKTINKYFTELGKLRITQLNELLIQDFLNTITKHRQRENIYLLIKASLRKAFELGIIKKDISTSLVIKKVSKKETKAFNKQEEQIFFDKAKETIFYDYFKICLLQGIREGELCALNIEDINFNSNTISINKTLNQFNKITTPKTKSSIRTIPLFKQTLEILEKYKNITGRIFNFNTRRIQSAFKEILSKTNLTNFTTHSLRHTFATRCAELGISPKITQKWLGHSTIAMTMNVYTHINKDFEDKNKNIFDTHFDTQN